jgi:hypothetical protein
MMRLTTEVWAKFESKGKPDSTLVVNKEIGFVARDFLKWLTEVTMGHNIRVTIARTKHEMERLTQSGKSGSQDMHDSLLGDFEKALEEMGLHDDFEKALSVPQDELCDSCGKPANDCVCEQN